MAQACAPNVNERRQNLVRILFVHRSLADVERCLHELKRLRFTVSSDVVLTPEQLAARVRVDCYDAIVSEYPSSNWDEEHVLDLVRRVGSNIPVVLLVHGMKREASAEFILKGAADCLEMENLGHLPVAVQRALDEKALRDQRDRAEKELRRSEARYRALAGNLSYGTCRCGLDGRFLEVNGALMRMLGYESKEELLAQDLARDVPGPRQAGPIVRSFGSRYPRRSRRNRVEADGPYRRESAAQRAGSARRA
jgi:PAS domain-containing protein